MHSFLFVRLNAPASLCKTKCTFLSYRRAFNFTTHTGILKYGYALDSTMSMVYIISSWKIIRKHLQSWNGAFQTMRTAVNIWPHCVGRKAFRVLNAGMIKPGIWPMVICCAESAVISSPSRREQSFKIHMFRWLHGSERCGISAFRKMEQAHWGYSGILVWGAIEQHG